MSDNVFSKIETHEDPMALVQAARDRGVEPKLVTGYDPAGDAFVVAWHIPDTDQIVLEGYRSGPPANAARQGADRTEGGDRG